MTVVLDRDIADAPAIVSRDAVEAVKVDFVADRAAWDDLLAVAATPHLPQSFAYGEGKQATGWVVRRAVFRMAGKVVAFATVLERHVLGMRVLARVNRGPVFLDAAPAAHVQRAVYAALRGHWRGPLMIAPALNIGPDANRTLRSAGLVQRQSHGWLSGLIDLKRDEASIWDGFSSSFRNRVRAAEKGGAELHVSSDAETYEWMLARHADNMRDKGFRAVGSALLRALRDTDPAAVIVFQQLHQGTPVAGMSVVQFGHHAEYHIGWFGPEGRRLNGGNFLMWNIVREMRRRGVFSFDVGGMKPGDGYTRFKRTMRPVEYELSGEWWSI